MRDIPVYVVAGFLDAGKTDFINGVLQDGFADRCRTLLICCEEGELGYDPAALRRVTVVTVEDEEELNPAQLQAWEEQYRPRQVLMEYNGMWKMERLSALPEHWRLYQVMVFVQADTFEGYARNMGQLMMEKILNADLLVFNRCTEEMKAMLRSRNLRMVNRHADIYLEDLEGNNEDYLTGEESPFDLTQERIEVPDGDFGVWYVDVMDHPDRYAGKEVHMKLMMCHSSKYPGIHCPGRFAMVCCEEDVQFLGLIARGDGLEGYENRDWIEVTARMTVEEHPAYDGLGPVMEVASVRRCGKPHPEVVTF